MGYGSGFQPTKQELAELNGRRRSSKPVVSGRSEAEIERWVEWAARQNEQSALMAEKRRERAA